MKIAVVCVTYNRPRQLGQMIRCFQRQDYARRELVILDDAGQYKPTEGPLWRLVPEQANLSG
jgi:glycosyltransferase involved in cell wall biosynthesis